MNDSRTYGSGIYVFAFYLKADIEKAPENLQMELSICSVILI
jgi:hypothetical protein